MNEVTGPAAAPEVSRPPWLVLAGASGGDGLRQLRDFVAALPRDLPAAVLVVLHRPVDQPSYFAEILRRDSELPVVIPHDGEPLRPGVCYVGLPDRHLSVGPGPTAKLVLDGGFRNRTVDLLFRSAAQVAGPCVVAVVLAGALDDGAAGVAAIREAGGVALVVDSVWAQRSGMPRSALRAAVGVGAAESVQELADAVISAVGAPAT